MKWSQDKTILKNNKNYLVWISNGAWVEYLVARYSDGTDEKEGFYESFDWDYDRLMDDDIIKGWFDISLIEE